MIRCSSRRLRVARTLLALFVALALLPANAMLAAPPDPPPDRRFGVVEAFWSPNQATEMGVGWERVVFFWNSLQPNSPDEWNPFYFPDEVLTQEINQGREVVGLLISTPAWAGGGSDPRLPPKNLYLPYDHPDNYWGVFVKKIASRYRGRIDSWIIWNEPDIWDAQKSSATWLGSEADYYQLLKVAHQAAKSVNPSSKIVFGGLTYWWDKSFGKEFYLKRVLDIASRDPSARANGFYFDVANLHLYSIPEQMYSVPQYMKKVLAEYGLAKPIWVSEMNVVPHDDPTGPLPRGDFRASLEEQASFVIQATALSMAGGVERVALYKMQDGTEQQPDIESYGVTRKDGTARPAFAALRAAAKYLSGTRNASWVGSKDLNTVVANRNGEFTTVLWNNGPKPITVTVPAATGSALLVDKYGMAATIAPAGGKYNLVLPAATAHNPADGLQSYFIGGDPFMLVELGQKAIELPASLLQEQVASQAMQRSQAATPPPSQDRVIDEERNARARQAALEAEQQKTTEQAMRQDRIAGLIIEIQSYIDQHDWQIAARKIMELNDIDPQNPKGREFQLVVQREMKGLELRSRAAEYYRSENWSAAIDALRQLLTLYPEDLMLKAQIEAAYTESDKARLIKLAEEFIAQGRLDDAQQAFEIVLSKDSRNRKALDGLANLQVYRWNQARSQSWP